MGFLGLPLVRERSSAAEECKGGWFRSRLACESPGVGQPRLLDCQLGAACSLPEGTLCAAGRSLPGMKLAFALMAAINGFTGSCATLSHGLWLPHQASPASARRRRVLTRLGRGRKRPPFRSGSRCGSPADFRRSTAVGAKQPWRAGPTTRRHCRCSGLGSRSCDLSRGAAPLTRACW